MTGTLGFGLAIALGACLLFQIQFLLGKLVLPWFGGAPAVWSTSLVVFQALLLAGYAYAHALARLPSRDGQVRRHLALVAVVVLALGWRAFSWPSPVTPGDAWKPDPDGSPVLQIVLLLTGAIGVPFVMLASTSPLLQRWHADAFPGRSPYRLYALSNLGSLVGLLSYPLLIEPRLDLAAQGRWWTVGCLIFAMLVGGLAWRMRGIPVFHETDPAHSGADNPRPLSDGPPNSAPGAPRRQDYVLWLLLAAVPSALLQATTSRITQDVGSMPFLWMVPLALYLLTFILAFEFPRFYVRHLLTLAIALGAAAAVPEWSPRVTLAVTFGMLVLTGLGFHGELAVRAPAPAWLTRFFLVVSAGGVLGSAGVALGAPLLFNGVLEYPLTLSAAMLVLAVVYWNIGNRESGVGNREPDLGNRESGVGNRELDAGNRQSGIGNREPDLGNRESGVGDREPDAGNPEPGIGNRAMDTGDREPGDDNREAPHGSRGARSGTGRGMRGIAAALAFLGLFIAGKTALGWQALTDNDVFASRNFFGAVRVREETTAAGLVQRRLQHGTTLHGVQYVDGEKARQPISYYTPSSGLGQAMASLAALGRPARIGVVGLGTGTTAAYGRKGDDMTIFEIDPQVVALSTAPTPLFTYLRDSEATIHIVGGDARLSLERASPSRFDLLVLDAFSSDAVPVHLLTREAVQLYGRHLRDARSLLVIHVSNRYLDLEGVVQAAGRAAGFTTVQVDDDVVDDDSERTTWMVLARDPEALRLFGEPLEGEGGPLWTDASSNLLSVLRRD